MPLPFGEDMSIIKNSERRRNSMKMWIARTQSNELCIFREKPFLLNLPELKCPIWVYETKLTTGHSWRNIGERIDSNEFPEVTFENSPMEVELKLIEK